MKTPPTIDVLPAADSWWYQGTLVTTADTTADTQGPLPCST